MRRDRHLKSCGMHWRSKRRAQSATGFQVEPVISGASKVRDVKVELVNDPVYWIRLTDRRLTGSSDWQIARQCFDDKFMVIGMLVVLCREDIAEVGPLVPPPRRPYIVKSEPPSS